MRVNFPLPIATLCLAVLRCDCAEAQVPGTGEAIRDGACCHTPEEPPERPGAHASDKVKTLFAIYEEAQASDSFFFGEGMRERLAASVAELEKQGAAADRTKLYGARFWLGMQAMRTGRIAQSVAEFEKCVALSEQYSDLPPSFLIDSLYYLGVANFRRAEVDNCIANHNVESCIFPLSAKASHIVPNGAEASLAVFDRLLKIPGNHRQLEARWLYNLVAMALRRWPEQVPEAWLYSPQRFGSEAPFPHLVDIGKSLGLNRYSHAGSMLADDFDGDGDLDVVSSSFSPGSQLKLFLRRAPGEFEEWTEESNLLGQLGGSYVVKGDLDGDGRLDLFVLRGGGLQFEGEWPPSLLLQSDPKRTPWFVDATAEAGLEIAAPTRSAALSDFDLDGDLDLFVGCESVPLPDGGVRWPSRLHRNDGASKFQDVTRAAGLSIAPLAGMCVGAVAGDVDSDGLPDLYCSIALAPNVLLRNAGNLTFRDDTAVAGLSEPLFSGVATFLDVENDGDLDLYVAAKNHIQVEAGVARYYLDGTVSIDTGKLFENDGTGIFHDVTKARGLERVAQTIGMNAGDLDLDGFPDLYLGTGGHEMSSLFPNVLLKNDRGMFRDVTFAAGAGHLQKTNTIGFADLDDDGPPEILMQTGGMYEDDRFGDVVFSNPGDGNHFLVLDLRSPAGNRFAVGAHVRVRIAEGDAERDVFAVIGQDSSFGGSSLRRTLGLGKATAIREIEIRWPTTGRSERLKDGATIPLDSRLTIVEGDPSRVEVRPRL